MPVEHINPTDSLNTGRVKLNAAIDQSNEAITKATYAETTANQAKSTADNVQAQFNQVVIEGDSSVEAAQARVDADGNVFTTLKERLDTKEQSFNAQLAQKATQADLDRREVNIEKFGAVKGQDATAAIQQAIDSLPDGGIVFIPQGTFLISNTLLINKAVSLKGVGGGHENDAQVLLGSVLKLADNTNKDMILVQYGGTYSDRRVPIEISGLTLDGNKSKNTSGHGIHVIGSRYVKIKDNYITRCKGDGIRIYNDGAVISNTNWVIENHIIYCDGNGINATCADSMFAFNHTAFSGNHGILVGSRTNTFISNFSWYNKSGIYCNNSENQFIGNRLYDNNECGLILSGCERITVTGNQIHSNGRNTAASTTLRCGILISGVCKDIELVGNITDNEPEELYQTYGIRIADGTSEVNIISATGSRNIISLLDIPATNKVRLHNVAQTNREFEHVGFKATGDINMDGKYIKASGFLGLQPVSSSVVPNNAFFIHSSDNVLKFKDDTGVIKIVNLT